GCAPAAGSTLPAMGGRAGHRTGPGLRDPARNRWEAPPPRARARSPARPRNAAASAPPPPAPAAPPRQEVRPLLSRPWGPPSRTLWSIVPPGGGPHNGWFGLFGLTAAPAGP